jgi:hypothetical protein
MLRLSALKRAKDLIVILSSGRSTGSMLLGKSDNSSPDCVQTGKIFVRPKPFLFVKISRPVQKFCAEISRRFNGCVAAVEFERTVRLNRFGKAALNQFRQLVIELASLQISHELLEPSSLNPSVLALVLLNKVMAELISQGITGIKKVTGYVEG